jgi:D-beta-D-heptose 7-phosphate kinase/D-beta-D-heptose 1-phosphate adenosyltransferase
MSAELISLVHRLGKPRVLVVGDVMLDRYVWGDAERISQEAPVILLRADKREERLGGASSVATMLRALGAEVSLVGVVGNDADGERIRKLLDDLEINHEAVLTDETRPSTVKERYVGRAQQRHPQQMIRVDYEVRDRLSFALEERFLALLEQQVQQTDMILISDYDKGVCTPALLEFVIAHARRQGKKTLVDPIRTKGELHPHPFRKYQGCSAMTPNRLEASLATGLPIQNIEQALKAATALLNRFDMEAGIVTLDKDGMALAHADGRREHYPTRVRQVYDITGAGDMVLSVLGLALASGADYGPAIQLANIAGGLEVEKIGVAPVTREEILHDLENSSRPTGSGTRHKIVTRAQLVAELQHRRSQGQKVAFTNGCFDLVHAGHVQYLQEARAQADLLIVGLNSDASVRRLKGPSRPINSETDRAEVLAGLAAVDYVTVFDEPTPYQLIKMIQPDVLIKGSDYRKEDVVGADLVEAAGGRVHLATFRDGFSTSNLLLKLTQQGERKQVA